MEGMKLKYAIFLMCATAILSAEPGANNHSLKVDGNWIYERDQDGMGRDRQIAWTLSVKDRPAGTKGGKLMLRRVGHSDDIMLSAIDGDLFVCGLEGCAVNVRFDEGKVYQFGASRSSDGSFTVLFLHGKNFMTELYKARRMRIEAEIFRQGMRTFDFNVEGLK